MRLWIQWWKMVRLLRPAFARETTFLWFALGLVGLTVRPDLRGVTSIIRALGLKEGFYDRLLDFFHSHAVHLDSLAALWCRLILTLLPATLVPKVQNRPVFIGDGIKVAKTGRQMPAVKKLHQESANNTNRNSFTATPAKPSPSWSDAPKASLPSPSPAAFTKELFSRTDRAKAYWIK